MKDIYIIGAGSYGEAIYELAEICGYNICGYYDDDESKQGTEIMNVPVLGKIKELSEKDIRNNNFAVAIGYGKFRYSLIEKINDNGGFTPTLIHPTAEVSKYATIGKGSFIQAGAYIWTKVEIGDGVIISPNTVIAHHSKIGKGCLISTNSTIGALITVEDYVFAGIGTIVITGVNSVGENTTIGAGATVIRDLPDNCVAVGCPAKVIKRKNRKNDFR